MADENTRTRTHDARIPLMILLPLLAVGLVLIWGFDNEKYEEGVHATFSLTNDIKTVKIVSDIGNVDVRIGSEGSVEFVAKTLRVTGSSELMDKARKAPYMMERVASGDLAILLLRVSAMPEGFRQPPVARDQPGDPVLFRQMDSIFEVPVDLAVIVEAQAGDIRVDTRQAKTTIDTKKGTVMALSVSAPLKVHNDDGSTVIAQHRGSLDMMVKGNCRVQVAAVAGPIEIVSEEGKVDLFLPRHGSFELDARALKKRIRNAFGFKAEAISDTGFKLLGKVGKGEHKVLVEARAGSLTVGAIE